MPFFTHNPPYSIVGQTGKSLGDGLELAAVYGSPRATFEAYGIESARLSMKSHATQTLSWFHRGDAAPDWEQEVSLYDADGNRVFKGNVSSVDPIWDGPVMNGWNVTVSDPWWWLEQAKITTLTEQDNSGWHYAAPITLGTQIPTPLIDSSDLTAVVVSVPTDPWGYGRSPTLYYTVDGLTPTTSSPVYTGPIAVSAGMTLKVYAKQSGYTDSAVAFASYTDQPAFSVPSQDLAASIAALMARMCEMGVPLDLGTVSATYPFLSMTWQGASGAVILRDMLDAIPDCMTCIDFSGSGNPRLNIIRRADADIATLALGSDLDLTGEPIVLKARRELRPSSVTVQGMLLNNNGEVSLTEETAGDAGGASGVLGRQFISVAGTGFHAFNQQATSLDKATLVTINVYYVQAMLNELNDALKHLIFMYGANPYAILAARYATGGWSAGGDSSWTYSWSYVDPFAQWWIDGILQTYIPTGGWYAVCPELGDKIPDWWEELGYKRCRMKVVVRCQAYFTAPATPEYFEANALTTIRSDVSGASYLFADIPIEFDAVNVDCGSRKAFVRPRDAFLVQPVAGLAGNLFNAQAYLNYDGTIPLLAGATKPLPGSVVNIRGAIAEWAMMRTPVTGCDINLDGGSAAVAVGTLSRQPANSLLDKFQRAVSGRILKL